MTLGSIQGDDGGPSAIYPEDTDNQSVEVDFHADNTSLLADDHRSFAVDTGPCPDGDAYHAALQRSRAATINDPSLRERSNTFLKNVVSPELAPMPSNQAPASASAFGSTPAPAPGPTYSPSTYASGFAPGHGATETFSRSPRLEAAFVSENAHLLHSAPKRYNASLDSGAQVQMNPLRAAYAYRDHVRRRKNAMTTAFFLVLIAFFVGLGTTFILVPMPGTFSRAMPPASQSLAERIRPNFHMAVEFNSFSDFAEGAPTTKGRPFSLGRTNARRSPMAAAMAGNARDRQYTSGGIQSTDDATTSPTPTPRPPPEPMKMFVFDHEPWPTAIVTSNITRSYTVDPRRSVSNEYFVKAGSQLDVHYNNRSGADLMLMLLRGERTISEFRGTGAIDYSDALELPVTAHARGNWTIELSSNSPYLFVLSNPSESYMDGECVVSQIMQARSYPLEDAILECDSYCQVDFEYGTQAYLVYQTPMGYFYETDVEGYLRRHGRVWSLTTLFCGLLGFLFFSLLIAYLSIRAHFLKEFDVRPELRVPLLEGAESLVGGDYLYQ
ncbi:hypothetical protein H696_03589 [Fonticula alba]|uniref:Uncharacterized protein n=1 Tax=Fonticula alba TaxID=691883 RepID=A0A058Z883_FONAL|nr:hypothetical protein H696_03589 [Fonticula alba]KCV70128.1 hypothetical protein H696_03589 [Fonticula alba]|eukprot:XP_009495734.1 hypothetical protein H696_03589 [Fonticula alba]